MRERPILFSTPMIQAILEGRKTQTRRIVKLPKKHKWGTEYQGQVIFDDDSTFGADIEVDELRCPHGQVGDRLWVRETWQFHDPLDVPKHRHGKVAPFVGCQGKRAINWVAVYRADGEIDDHPEFGKAVWRPSIFMPRWASRILLEITAIRVERLHDISGNDCIAEGISQTKYGCHQHKSGEKCISVQDGYKALWESINGVQSWLDNPWVWVITFKVVEIKQ